MVFFVLLLLQDEEDSLKVSNCMSALSVDPYLPEAVVAFKKLCTRGVGLSMVPVRASFIVGKLCVAVRN